MELNKKKKIAAIIGAIAMMEESKTILEEKIPSMEMPMGTFPSVTISPWAIFGRSYAMNLRIMWQSKLYK
ncbi:MAG: hypothetical protein N2202_00865 [Proteobacteria bacterium]|nr:hypothetical protein [Pseudomonadota bacterium]